MNNAIEDLRFIPAILSAILGLMFIFASIKGYGFTSQKWHRIFAKNRFTTAIKNPGNANLTEKIYLFSIGVLLIGAPFVWFLYKLFN